MEASHPFRSPSPSRSNSGNRAFMYSIEIEIQRLMYSCHSKQVYCSNIGSGLDFLTFLDSFFPESWGCFVLFFFFHILLLLFSFGVSLVYSLCTLALAFFLLF